jgi:hypothetical protein
MAGAQSEPHTPALPRSLTVVQSLGLPEIAPDGFDPRSGRSANWAVGPRPCSMTPGPHISMLQPARPRQRNHTGAGRRLWLNRRSIGVSLSRESLNPILFMIVDVITDKATQVPPPSAR